MFKGPWIVIILKLPANGQINNYTVGELSYRELHVKLFLLVVIFFPLYSSLWLFSQFQRKYDFWEGIFLNKKIWSVIVQAGKQKNILGISKTGNLIQWVGYIDDGSVGKELVEDLEIRNSRKLLLPQDWKGHKEEQAFSVEFRDEDHSWGTRTQVGTLLLEAMSMEGAGIAPMQ